METINIETQTIKLQGLRLYKQEYKSFQRYTYTKQLRSVSWSMKSKSWLMSYVIDGQSGFCLFKCSS